MPFDILGSIANFLSPTEKFLETHNIPFTNIPLALSKQTPIQTAEVVGGSLALAGGAIAAGAAAGAIGNAGILGTSSLTATGIKTAAIKAVATITPLAYAGYYVTGAATSAEKLATGTQQTLSSTGTIITKVHKSIIKKN
jgi:hypothetical protein